MANTSRQEEIQLETLKVQQKQLDLQLQNSAVLNNLVDKGLPLAQEYLNKKLERVEGPKIRWSIVGFISILFIVVLVSGFLVYVGKMDPGNFTFLLGTLIGASITFLGDVILPKE